MKNFLKSGNTEDHTLHFNDLRFEKSTKWFFSQLNGKSTIKKVRKE